MTERLKAILIDPHTQTISAIEIERGIHAIYKAIDAPCFDCVGLGGPHQETMYVDDEGLYRENQAFFELINGQTLAGKGVILSTDDEGESQSTHLSVEQVQKVVVWRPHAEVQGWTKPTEKEIPGFGFHIKAAAPKFGPKDE